MVERIFDTLFGIVKSICKVMLCVQVISVTIVFVGRYFFNVTPAWGEELTLFCLVWLSLMGASLPIRTGGHLHVTLLDFLCKPKTLARIDTIGDVLTIVFCGVIFVAGLAMTKQVSGTILHGIRISKGFLYAAVPTSMVFYLLALFDKYYRRLKHTEKREEDVL
ncbi:MAG: TRAP transporter small permease [Lachnospiraceae bacterium]|jgi:TRAP-type C4-dicarboxylate transport system permease small subunit|nr:TRAP transporter small permease [Lachnospiraceae bacterium]